MGMTITMLKGDCRTILPTLPDESVHCAVTSPPYWGLRDYGTATWEGGDPGCNHVKGRPGSDRADGVVQMVSHRNRDGAGAFSGDCACGARRIDSQIGLEPTPEAYVATMVEVFREVRRVLRKDGTVWVNLGDSYTTRMFSHNSLRNVSVTNGDWCKEGQRGILNGIAPPTSFDGLKPKDLCGIPWRVAFALQAPGYLGRIRNESDRAWLAALIDGEGCISILETTSGRTSGPVSTSYPPILQVRMCDPECIQKAMDLVGSESDNPARYPPSMEGQRPAYQWRIHGRKASDTIAEIYPFLLIKRKQAIVAWNAQAAREGYETKRGVKVPVAAIEKQKLCREIIQKLNQREPVDLPSWMVEPPLPIGPGWYLRQDLIWSKPNPMPESVTDRCTKAHEYIFLLSKSARYYYDADAIKENGVDPDRQRDDRIGGANGHLVRHSAGAMIGASAKRNKRSVWEVATAPFSEAHFATFPPALIEPCILAGCPEGGRVLDPFGGAGTTGLVADRLGRDATLIELNPEYAKMAEYRIIDDAPLFARVAAE
jgi:DNA modification methylase